MGHYVNVRRLREVGIVLSALVYNIQELMEDIPQPVRKRARCISTYAQSILEAVIMEIPRERREALGRNINNYQVEIIPRTQRTHTAEEATRWVLDERGIAALMALEPDACMMCDRWTEEEQRSCPRRRVLNALDITIHCDNAFDEPAGCQWVEDENER